MTEGLTSALHTDCAEKGQVEIGIWRNDEYPFKYVILSVNKSSAKISDKTKLTNVINILDRK